MLQRQDQFDPQIVDLFLKILPDDWAQVRDEEGRSCKPQQHPPSENGF